MSNPDHEYDYVIAHGGDVSLCDDDTVRNYDRIGFTAGGLVVCINKASYTKDCYPRERVEAVHTHTTDAEEDAGWW